MGIDSTVRSILPETCTGCALCCNVCQVDAIKMRPDSRGFLHPIVDEFACTECGLCLKKCPVRGQSPTPRSESPKRVCAAFSLDDEVRYESTSGGLFTELARPFLAEGGVVIGAVYGKEGMICHGWAENESDLSALRQSKYAQSDKGVIYRFALSQLRKGKKVMFCGAPCETAAMATFAGGLVDNLTLVDFLCLGANSPKVYKAYLEDLEQTYGSKVKRVWFKSKQQSWNSFGTRVEFENEEVYFQDRFSDLFMRGYIIYPLFIRRSCTHCRFKNLPHESDITLGDFWGVEKIIPDIDVSHGVSIVLVNSGKGDALLRSASNRLNSWEVPFEQALASDNQNALLRSVSLHHNSDRFFAEMERTSFSKAVLKCTSSRLPALLVCKLKGIARWILSHSKAFDKRG